MGDEAEVEVEVTVNEPEPVDTDGDGVPDAFEVGQASAHAEHAAEAADEAQETAEEAAAMAESAGTVAVEAADENYDQNERLDRLEAIAVGTNERLERLAALLEASANVQAAQIETTALAPQPQDELPASRSWLNRKIGW